MLHAQGVGANWWVLTLVMDGDVLLENQPYQALKMVKIYTPTYEGFSGFCGVFRFSIWTTLKIIIPAREFLQFLHPCIELER